MIKPVSSATTLRLHPVTMGHLQETLDGLKLALNQKEEYINKLEGWLRAANKEFAEAATAWPQWNPI